MTAVAVGQSPTSTAAAGLLEHQDAELVSLRADVDALADELLNRYEEVTLLYDLSRELGVVLDVPSASRTALLRSLQVIPAELGVVLIGTGPADLLCVASAGAPGADGGRSQVAEDAGRAAMTQHRQVMVHAGDELVPGSGPAHEPVLAAPLFTGEGDPGQTGSAGVLVFVGHSADDRFSAGEAQLAAAVARQLGLGVENARLVSALREKERLEGELELAAGIQRSLLPPVPPETVTSSFAAACLPAAQVGGDYYDFVPGEDGMVYAVVADVTGHGLGPGLMMAMTRSVLRAGLRGPGSLPEALASTNTVMWDDLVATGLFITLFAVSYDPATGRLGYVNGGHHPALLRLPDAAVVELDSDGMPYGLLPDPPYEEGTRVLQPGTCLLIFSDGIVEARAPDGAMFGTPRLREFLAEWGAGSAPEVLALLLDELERFRDGTQPDDDVTLVVIRISDGPEASTIAGPVQSRRAG